MRTAGLEYQILWYKLNTPDLSFLIGYLLHPTKGIWLAQASWFHLFKFIPLVKIEMYTTSTSSAMVCLALSQMMSHNGVSPALFLNCILITNREVWKIWNFEHFFGPSFFQFKKKAKAEAQQTSQWTCKLDEKFVIYSSLNFFFDLVV